LLLPTPQARDHYGAQLPEVHRAGGHQVNLNDVTLGLVWDWEHDGWGRYEPAIRHWERVLARLAPFPAERARSGRFRLSVDFSEWAMGLPAGWVTGVPGLPYAAMIRALGNGVVPAPAAALRLLIEVAAVPGVPRSADLTAAHELGLDAGGPGRKASRACPPATPKVRCRPAPTAAAWAPSTRVEGSDRRAA
jgi:hypothetical protein